MIKPDFIIVGAMKSATSTLYEQLALQNGIFMTTPKEPNYFSDDEQYSKGEAWYESLFVNARRNDLCGESSTHYTKLPDYSLTVERMAKRLKSPKLIYVIRHPIDRLVSHYMHQWSQNVMSCNINEAIEQYEELTAYSCYARQLEPYVKQFGRDNILLVCNESIRQNPQEQLQRVADFIGYQGVVRWENGLGAQNVSADRVRTFKGSKWLVESNAMTFLRRTLVPQSIRDKVKKKLTMQNRPVIDSIHLEQLIMTFNADLACLGAALDVRLSCDNYKQVVTKVNLSWAFKKGRQ